MKKIGIIGSGPVGSILAVNLNNSGHDIHIVDVLPHLIDAIKSKGIQLERDKKLITDFPKAYNSIKELYDKKLDFIFICVKANALCRVIELLKDFNLKNISLISFQNGIDTEELLAVHFPREKVFRGVVNYAGMLIEPGVVKMTFFHPPNYIGCLALSEVKTAHDIAEILSSAGLETQYSANIKKEVWRKAILNSTLMPVSVITRLTMAKIMKFAETRKIVENLLKELIEIAKAEGYIYEQDFFEKAITYLSNAGEHKTSMLVDFESGRELEIDFLNYKFQEYAEKHHFSCEYNNILVSLIKGLLLYRDTKT